MAFTTTQTIDSILTRGLNFRLPNNAPISSLYTLYANGQGQTYWSNSINPTALSSISSGIANTETQLSSQISTVNSTVVFQSTQIQDLYESQTSISTSLTDLSNFSIDYINSTVNSISSISTFFFLANDVLSTTVEGLSTLSTSFGEQNTSTYNVLESMFQSQLEFSIISTTTKLELQIDSLSSVVAYSSNLDALSTQTTIVLLSTSAGLNNYFTSSISTLNSTLSTSLHILSSTVTRSFATNNAQISSLSMRVSSLEEFSTIFSTTTNVWINSVLDAALISTTSSFMNSISTIEQTISTVYASTITDFESDVLSSVSTATSDLINIVNNQGQQISTLTYEFSVITTSSILAGVYNTFIELEGYTSTLIASTVNTINPIISTIYTSTIDQNNSIATSFFSSYVSSFFTSSLSIVSESTIAFASTLISTLYSTGTEIINSTFTSTIVGISERQYESSILGYVSTPAGQTISTFTSTMQGVVVETSTFAYSTISATYTSSLATLSSIESSTVQYFNEFVEVISGIANQQQLSNLYSHQVINLSGSNYVGVMDMVDFRNFYVNISNLFSNTNTDYRLTYDSNVISTLQYRRGIITLNVDTVGYAGCNHGFRFDVYTLGIPTIVWSNFYPSIINYDYEAKYEYTIVNNTVYTNLLNIYPRFTLQNLTKTTTENVFSSTLGSIVDNTYWQNTPITLEWINYSGVPLEGFGGPTFNPHIAVELLQNSTVIQEISTISFNESTITFHAPVNSNALIEGYTAKLYIVGKPIVSQNYNFSSINAQFNDIFLCNVPDGNNYRLLLGNELVVHTYSGRYPLKKEILFVSENQWNSVAWAPELGIFAVVASSGVNNRVMTSSDGINWRARTSAANNQWLSVTWSPQLGVFVAVANSGQSNRVMISSNGIDWIVRQNIQSSAWTSICWSPELGIFVAVAASSEVMSSSDTVNWIPRTSTPGTWQSVTWSPQLGLFVAVAYSGGAVMTSSDGINWISRTPAAVVDWRSISWSPELGIFVVVGDSATIMISSNGINWIAVNSGQNTEWYSVCWSPELGMFAAIGRNNRIMTSLNGLNWIARISPANNQWNSVVWSPQLRIFVAVASSGTGNRIMTSSNGINWALRNSKDTITTLSLPPRPNVNYYNDPKYSLSNLTNGVLNILGSNPSIPVISRSSAAFTTNQEFYQDPVENTEGVPIFYFDPTFTYMSTLNGIYQMISPVQYNFTISNATNTKTLSFNGSLTYELDFRYTITGDTPMLSETLFNTDLEQCFIRAEFNLPTSYNTNIIPQENFIGPNNSNMNFNSSYPFYSLSHYYYPLQGNWNHVKNLGSIPLAGLSAWYDADSFASGQWFDKSVNARHSISIQGDPIKSGDGVVFNGSSRVFIDVPLNTGGITGWTIFMVANVSGTNQNYMFFNSPANYTPTFITGYRPNAIEMFGTMINNNVNTLSSSFNSNRFIAAYRINANLTMQGYFNGQLTISDSVINPQGTQNFAVRGIGGSDLDPSLIGSVNDFIIYNRPLSDAEVNQVHTYLQNKYFTESPETNLIPVDATFNSNFAKNATVSAAFNGTTSFAQFPNNSINYSSFTCMGWFYLRGTQNNCATLLNFGRDQNNYASLKLNCSNANIMADIKLNNSNASYSTNVASLSTNAWNHVAFNMNRSASQSHIILNGNIVASTNTLLTTDGHWSNLISGSNNYIARSNYPGESFFNGFINELILWNTSIPNNAISTIYELQKNEYSIQQTVHYSNLTYGSANDSIKEIGFYNIYGVSTSMRSTYMSTNTMTLCAAINGDTYSQTRTFDGSPVQVFYF